MRRGTIFSMLAAAALVAGGLALPTAALADSSSIDHVRYSRGFDVDPHHVVVRLQAFDAAGVALPFTGSVTVGARPGVVGVATASSVVRADLSRVVVAVGSRTGAAVDAVVDVRRLKVPRTGTGVTWRLTARGEDVPFRDPRTAVIRLEKADGGALPPGVRRGETVVSSSLRGPFTGVAGEWDCVQRRVLWSQAACFVDRPRTTRTAARLGTRIELRWVPQRHADGTLYARCVLQPLKATTGSGAGAEGHVDLPAIDVPGTWTFTAVPIDAARSATAQRFGNRAAWRIACYDSEFDDPDVQRLTGSVRVVV